jgi:hypothetical protein
MKKLVSLREALNRPELLADALPGDSWSAWRTLLIAAVGEELNDEEREVFTRLTGREREPNEMIEVMLTVAGRRSGKTKAMATLAVYLSTLVDWSDDLSLGEHGAALFLAPTEKMAERAHRYSTEIIGHVELLSSLVEARTTNTMALKRGIDLETQPASWRHSRGFTSICVALDECAFLRTGDDSANPDTEILTALKPSLATTGGPMLLTSSPSTMEGIVYRLWKRHYGAAGDPRCLVVHADTRALNPSLRKSVIDRAYEDDPAAASAEYGGEFREPVSAYLDRAVVERAVETGVGERRPLPGVDYFAFVDVAGGSGTDSFTCAVGHVARDADRDVIVIDIAFETKPPFNPDDVVRTLCAHLRASWRITEIYGDAYGSQWPVSAFALHGITYRASPLTASELYQHALPAWTSGRVAMLDLPRCVEQLVGLRRRIGQGGRESIGHQRGSHDDLANVISGVIWKLTPVEPPLVFVEAIEVRPDVVGGVAGRSPAADRSAASGYTGFVGGVGAGYSRFDNNN